MDLKPLLRVILQDYALDWNGHHGIAHWARVLENGLRVAFETGANADVVALFAILHDSKRVNEAGDMDHGPRAAEFALSLRDRLIQLPDDDFYRLHRACAGHTIERFHSDVTIQTCWDADRLDLGRIGVTPHASRLCTDFARHPTTIKWADGRARFNVIPDFVRDEWGINLHERQPVMAAEVL